MKKEFKLIYVLCSFLLISCGEDDPAPQVDKLEANEVRIVADVTAPGIATTDKYFLAGSFKSPNDWKENGIFELTKRADGKFYIDVTADQIEGTTLNFKVQRNGLWQYVEKDATCAEISNRELPVSANLGKEFAITVVAFRNTGTCPD